MDETSHASPSREWSRQRTAGIVLVLFFFGGLAFTSFLKIHNNDIFWHLSTGREILKRQQISWPNDFDSTTDGRVNQNVNWLFQVFAYPFAALDSENFTYLILLRILFLAAVYGLLWRLGRRFGLDPPFIACLLILSFLAGSFRLYMRTFLVTYLMIALFIGLLDSDARREKGDRRLLWLLPLLMVVWTNVHAICVIGLAVIGLAWTALLIRAVVQKEGFGRVKQMTLVGVLTFAATFVSPHPGKNYERIWLAMVEYPKTILVREEVRPAFFAHIEFYVLLFAGLALIPLALRRRRWFEVLLFATFGFFAVRNIRFVGAFSIGAMPLFFSALTEAPLRQAMKKAGRSWLAFLLAVTAMLAGFSTLHDKGPAWGQGVDCAKLPCGALDFIEDRALGLKMYNPLGFGGYIIWRGYPQIKPFWDGRFEAQKHLFFHLPREGFPTFLAENGFHLALMRNGRTGAQAQRMDIEEQILADAAWKLVYFDRNALLLAYPSQQTDKLSRFAYRILKPWEPGLGLPSHPMIYDLEQAIKEAERALHQRPNDPFCLWVSATLLRKIGQLNAARDRSVRCLEVAPGNPACLSMMGMIDLSEDLPGPAIGHLSRAVTAGAGDAPTRINLGVAYLKVGDLRRARKTLLRALRIDPENPTAHFNLALVYEAMGQADQAARHRSLAGP